MIWEFIPIDPALLPPPVPGNDPVLLPPPPVPSPLKRRPKKGRKNPSGLDFAKKKTSGKNSRGVSRATSPEPVGSDVETHDISYTLDHLLAEINRWVIDKSAGKLDTPFDHLRFERFFNSFMTLIVDSHIQ